MAAAIEVTLFTDPGCPWAYSVGPSLAVLRWRYREQLRWRVVTIGLTESAAQYEKRGFTPARAAQAYAAFRRYGMPFATEPRARMIATGRACRAIVATRLVDSARELDALRALQLAWFTTPLLLDEDEALARALARVDGLDVDAVVGRLDDPQVEAAYQSDRELTRSAQGSPTQFQGKARQTDGPVRYSAPSLIFTCGERRLEAGGFQPVEAYDVLVANLDPTMSREGVPESAAQLLDSFPAGLVTQEVAAMMAHNNAPPDRRAAESALIELAAAGRATREPLGDDALWRAAR